MNIDFKKTEERAKILKMSELGRQCGIRGQTAGDIVRGIYRSMDSDSAARVITKLREYNCLVEKPADDDKIAA